MRATRWCRSSSAPASPAPRLSLGRRRQGFAAERVWKGIAELGVGAFVPPQRTMLPDGRRGEDRGAARGTAARERCKTPLGIWAHRRRMADAEGGIAELKNEHGLGRARCRGTSLFHVQLLLGCTALNAKRLTRRGDAASGQAAGPATARAGGEETAADAVRRQTARRHPSRRRPSPHLSSIVSASRCDSDDHPLDELTAPQTGFLDSPLARRRGRAELSALATGRAVAMGRRRSRSCRGLGRR